MSEPRDDITLLEGRRYFEAMFEAIDAAQEEVLAETYVFQFDRTGSEFIERASRAARRGVRVRMIADGLGSPQLTLAGEQRVRDAGIDLVVHHRPGFIPLAALHGRMHRKLLVVDRREVFLGGLNIADEYAG
ncbi:MAG: phospholipase D-like domain-containing protein, partial [Phycisphaerae bacterium]